jgi:large subunit ribosomal protein L24
MARVKQQILAKRHAAAKKVKVKLRKDDIVKVIAGRDRGKSGRVLEVDRVKGRVVVEGVMMVKRHTKPNPSQQIKGGIAERESTIAISNIMLVASDGKPTRVGFKVEGTGSKARRVRVARRTGETIEKGGK